MFITKKHLSRRTVLRGALGTAVALPFLDAMVVAAQAQPPAQLRFGAIYVPNGVRPEVWTPAPTPALALPPLLVRFEPLREHINVVTGLCSAPQSEHHSATSLWLHGGFLRKTEGPDVRNAKTIDQHIADAIGQDTALRSLELGIEDMSGSPGSCAFGFSCIYMNTLSWRTPTAPMPMELNPQTVFERLFGDSGTPEQRAARWREKASVLDSVLAAAQSLHGNLGAQDRVTIDEYLDNVREVERRIQLAQQQTESDLDLPAAPTGVPSSYEEHVKLMYELVTLALRADVTRVFTFMKGVEASPINYPQIGVAESHHIVSHHENKTEAQQKYAKINAYHLSLFGDFVEQLRATPDGDGSLLDHSLIMYGSGMGNGNIHDHTKLPILLAGGASGRVRGGRHIANPDPTPIANLIASLGDVAGLDLGELENGTGRVAL
jgi:hypothetical protein